MSRHELVANRVKEAYTQSTQNFGQWMWKHHVPVVAQKAEALSHLHHAHVDIAVAGAWLHDFGDAFVQRHAEDHERISTQKAKDILTKANYTKEEINQVLTEVIAPHSCRAHFLPTTLEGKILATADSLAHLTTDFYIQFAWMHLPENKNYTEFIEWVQEKLERDFNSKLFFEETKTEIQPRYAALKEVFSRK